METSSSITSAVADQTEPLPALVACPMLKELPSPIWNARLRPPKEPARPHSTIASVGSCQTSESYDLRLPEQSSAQLFYMINPWSAQMNRIAARRRSDYLKTEDSFKTSVESHCQSDGGVSHIHPRSTSMPSSDGSSMRGKSRRTLQR
jgi:hypothetical protein